MLTYQHHIVDVIGGFVLALICFHAIPGENSRNESDEDWKARRNSRVIGLYALGAVISAVIGFCNRGLWLLMLWPAISLALTALAYVHGNTAIYQKRNGKIPLSAKALFGPSLLGQSLSLLHYRRSCGAWNPVTERVWMGVRLREDEARAAIQKGVTAILDLTAELSEAPSFRKRQYLNLPTLDLTALSPAQLKVAAEFIERESARGIVYVHCKVGYSRSAAAVGAYLLKTGQARTVDDALKQIRTVRPGIILRPETRQSLEGFVKRLDRQTAHAFVA